MLDIFSGITKKNLSYNNFLKRVATEQVPFIYFLNWPNTLLILLLLA